ncbi:methylated-DNA--[protein]-cysteine S-methyltransferase [Ruficoccus sp. ZRK36]|uniref:methylated-DNA--[protein]-cysteine S-methyltransferase n=1 Tax=Ruficoccus sp. ZRK36 TaxID=2866311 RepID=UPI001C737D56|nr:methylated-DNA--[protein]-cysteine S-methyltransferase [Ruficoccus sp. ZRK36]QYY36612.1 methylated-DNA--[protein]-cysteine S-methyltransferase [Ruficoccus sp. ZRK36]
MNPSKVSYGLASSPFGRSLVAFRGKTLLYLGFPEAGEQPEDTLQGARLGSDFARDDSAAQWLADQVFSGEHVETAPVGTAFQQAVWDALKAIPAGETRTYSDIAQAVGRPSATRAVGTAIGRNPLAWLIPCHRVIRRDGTLGGYRWGLTIKRRLLAEEASQVKAA